MNKVLGIKYKGSLTVEAALVFPIFIYAVIAFAYFLQIIGIQEHLQNAITETGYFAAKYAYVYDYISNYDDTQLTEENKENNNTENNNTGEVLDTILARSIDSVFYKNKMKEYLDIKRINESCIENGFSGIHTYLSSYMEDEDSVDIILLYNIKIPLLFINLNDFSMMQRVRMRGWSGHEVALKNSPADNSDEQGKEDVVYITETGTVYHLTKECTHLKLSVRAVTFNQVESLRNLSGGKFKKCSLCCHNEVSSNQKVYITNTGDCYHQDLNCSGLKRTIIEIPISQIGNRSRCKRCGN